MPYGRVVVPKRPYGEPVVVPKGAGHTGAVVVSMTHGGNVGAKGPTGEFGASARKGGGKVATKLLGASVVLTFA